MYVFNHLMLSLKSLKCLHTCTMSLIFLPTVVKYCKQSFFFNCKGFLIVRVNYVLSIDEQHTINYWEMNWYVSTEIY